MLGFLAGSVTSVACLTSHRNSKPRVNPVYGAGLIKTDGFGTGNFRLGNGHTENTWANHPRGRLKVRGLGTKGMGAHDVGNCAGLALGQLLFAPGENS